MGSERGRALKDVEGGIPPVDCCYDGGGVFCAGGARSRRRGSVGCVTGLRTPCRSSSAYGSTRENEGKKGFQKSPTATCANATTTTPSCGQVVTPCGISSGTCA